MNVQSAVDHAGRLIDQFQRQARDFLAKDSDTEEPTAGALWQESSSALDRALAVYERKESPDTPESSWIPGRETKASCQRDLDKILDTLLGILGVCGAAGYRTRIRNLRADNATSQSRIAKYREQLVSAPVEQAQNFVEGLLVSSKEAVRDSISDETDRISERNRQIESLKVGFRELLQHIGISVSPEAADSFLLPTEDDIVAMAAVISNIGLLTEQLQQLVDASKEAPEQTKRYYGIYVLLVFAVDRIQTHFVQKIDEAFLPRVAENEKDALQHIADAQAGITAGSPQETLTANIAANRRTIEACRLLANLLQSHRRTILDQNRKVRLQETAAVNTYRTVCTGLNVAELIGGCETAFQALRELKLPPLRSFQNAQLNEEVQKLAERVTAKD